MKIVFIYRKSQQHLGSVKMRVFQFMELLREKERERKIELDSVGIYTPKIKLYEYLWTNKLPKNSIAIFNKDAINRASSLAIRLLRKKNIKIGLDAIDKDMMRFDYNKVDFLIASSYRQYIYFSNLKKNLSHKIDVFYIPHQADIRLKKYNPTQILLAKKEKSIFYFGEHNNIYLPAKFLNRVDIIDYSGTMDEREIKIINKYKFQYCIRGPQQNTSLYIFKPITKIINSLYLGSFPVISFDMDDALHALGESYPFVLKEYSEKGFQDLFQVLEAPPAEYLEKALICMARLESHLGYESIIESFYKAIEDIAE